MGLKEPSVNLLWNFKPDVVTIQFLHGGFPANWRAEEACTFLMWFQKFALSIAAYGKYLYSYLSLPKGVCLYHKQTI